MKVIRFLIPIYLISEDSEKYIITEKSFKYYLYLKDFFKDEIKIEFTIVGSERKLSKNLVSKYFNNNDSYLEYDQGDINYFNRVNFETLNTVVGKKIKAGYDICKKHNPDFIIFIKSNHFICSEWLRFIINDTDEDKFYGFSVLSNVFIMTTLTDNNKIDHNDKYIFDNRKHPPVNLIDACLIAIPKKVYNIYEMGTYNLTEHSIANEIINLGYTPALTSQFYIFNIKSKNELTNVMPFSYIKDKNSQQNEFKRGMIENYELLDSQNCDLHIFTTPENYNKINSVIFSSDEYNFLIKLNKIFKLIDSL